ncbi:aminotransferase-like domain-containing protein [Streptomyces johnsoniae]|uniref:PLP-dependent aminotransferase family protein n=1 Tax=Streptomyces johnsoniae TaxID=3075532 RepID=A0ABU2S6B7_9ACTN|nr:PLP-dependent aminotransferase family protein [Streptomyces sp. DSM 41886]MDT0444516.1 PLP-dependent aminotransferase family protein [Streptomyces sp. DSM 41886]
MTPRHGQAAGRPALAARMGGLSPSAIGSVLRLGDRSDVISLAGGLPAREASECPEAAAVLGPILGEHPTGLDYGDTNGLPTLREWIAGYLRADLGADSEPDDVVVVHGAQQGIDLVCKALLDPGDVVVVDRPSYIGALQVFRLFQAEVRAVPLADDPELGELTEALAHGLRPRLLYTVPNYSNPSGAVLTASQRRRLAGLAERYGFLLVEDDPYRELWLTDERPSAPALTALTDRSVHLGSFSKILFPGCRIGYLTGPPAVMSAITLVRQAADLGNSELLQRMVLALLTQDGFLDRRLDRLRALYRERRDALASALSRHLPGAAFRPPEGGFFLWATLGPGLDSALLLPSALKHGVSYVPGAAFYPSRPEPSTARLAFSCLPPEQAGEAAARLARALGGARADGPPEGGDA